EQHAGPDVAGLELLRHQPFCRGRGKSGGGLQSRSGERRAAQSARAELPFGEEISLRARRVQGIAKARPEFGGGAHADRRSAGWNGTNTGSARGVSRRGQGGPEGAQRAVWAG